MGTGRKWTLRSVLLALFALAPAGCGGSPAAAPHATAVVAERPKPAHLRPPDAATQRAMGQILAIDSLAHDGLGLLDDAATAQAQQLPDTARADSADAARRLAGTERVLAGLEAPSRFDNALQPLRLAVWNLGIAAANRSPPGAEVRAGRKALRLADARLRGTIDPALAGVARARLLALRDAAWLPQSRPAARPVRHRVTRTTRRVRPTATSIPTATARPTARVAFVVHVTRRRPRPRRRIHRPVRRTPTHTVRTRVRVRPTSTPPPTSTPVPTATPRPRPTAVPASVAALAPYQPRLRVARTQIDTAWHASRRCSATLDGIGSGADTGGSAPLRACVLAASVALRQAARTLTPIVQGVDDPAVSRAFRAALGAVRQARSALRSAGQSVEAVNLEEARQQLVTAGTEVNVIRRLLATVIARRPL